MALPYMIRASALTTVRALVDESAATKLARDLIDPVDVGLPHPTITNDIMDLRYKGTNLYVSGWRLCRQPET
jgi:hypothetical protein